MRNVFIEIVMGYQAVGLTVLETNFKTNCKYAKPLMLHAHHQASGFLGLSRASSIEPDKTEPTGSWSPHEGWLLWSGQTRGQQGKWLPANAPDLPRIRLID
jgi:hypothetical protein